MLFCRRHWFLIPKPLREAIQRAYQPRKDIDAQSQTYTEVMTSAIDCIVIREAKRF